MADRPKWQRRLPWAFLAAVVVAALFLGSGAVSGQTTDDRVMAIAATIKCPQCADQSAATSEAPTAVAIRKDILVRLHEGQSADDIRGYYSSVYGDQLLLNPSRSGVASLVWILPAFALVAAFGFLGMVFARWRSMDAIAATDADRVLVAQAKGLGDDGAVDKVDSHGEGDGA